MTQNHRQAAIDGFRGGKYDILVATDIAARGIDVSQISHVINFDMPDTADAYTHRIGRTGRAHETGEAITFAAPADEVIVRDIEKVLGARIERRCLPGFDPGACDQGTRQLRSGSGQPQPPQSRRYRLRFRPSVASRKRNLRPAGVSGKIKGVLYGN
jgi:ATP-dependent RNA helicase RhlE